MKTLYYIRFLCQNYKKVSRETYVKFERMCHIKNTSAPHEPATSKFSGFLISGMTKYVDPHSKREL